MGSGVYFHDKVTQARVGFLADVFNLTGGNSGADRESLRTKNNFIRLWIDTGPKWLVKSSRDEYIVVFVNAGLST
jgi:hypothetical protein